MKTYKCNIRYLRLRDDTSSQEITPARSTEQQQECDFPFYDVATLAMELVMTPVPVAVPDADQLPVPQATQW